ncbi:hypothetical protein FXO38_31704 [Capsicum annuum]|nr:hypothetical protein FXO38_31704 [Capsicum annuum]
MQAQLCRCVMTLEVKGSSSSGILICANGTFLNFTPRKFAIIIGLNYVSNRYDFIFYEGVPNSMVEKYFNGAEIIQKRQLFLAFTEKVWGENNDEDAEKFAILYFLHSFVLSNVETVVIPRLHFDLVDSERYKDFPWGSLSFEELARSLNNRLKAGGQFYLIRGMSLVIQVWLYECCSNVPPKIASKVDNRIPRLLNWKTIAPRPRFEFLMNVMFNDNGKVFFKNIEPTKKELAKLQIPKKDAIQYERSVDSDDDFQDPSPRKINEHSKKKRKVDSSTPVAKKPLRKKQINEHTQTRTPAPRAAKADGMKTPVFKQIPTRQASSSKMKKGKQTARVIFSQVQSKPDIHVEEVAVSKSESHVEKEAFISKKDFDAFRNEDQVVDIEADKPNVDEGGLEQSGQYFNPDIVQSSDNIYDGTKGCTDLHSEKMNVEIDCQQLIPDELLRSINLDYLHSEKVVQHDCLINRGIIDLSSNSLVNSEVELATEEQVRTPPNTQEVTNDEQRDEQLWPNSQNTIPDEFLPSLNVYDQKSIMIHPSVNHKVKTPRPKLRIKRPSKFKESPYTEKFGSITDKYNKMKGKVDHYKREKSEIPKMHFGVETVEDKNWFYTMGFADKTWTDSYIDVCLYYLKKKSKYRPHSSYKNEPNKSYKYSTVDCNFMNVIRSLNDVYSMDHQNLNAGGQKHHLIEYINGFRMHAVVPWHTVGHYATVLAETEKIAKIIPLCLQACDFYVKKGIDLQNHPRYKDKESSDMFDILFEDDLPQQPSGSLDCGVFMVMYAEWLSYGHRVIATEFDPNALRTRYAALLWDYGIRK